MKGLSDSSMEKFDMLTGEAAWEQERSQLLLQWKQRMKFDIIKDHLCVKCNSRRRTDDSNNYDDDTLKCHWNWSSLAK